MLFQVPGLLIVAAIGVVAHLRWGLPVWTPPALFLFWLAKDLVLYPLVRRSYEKRPATNGADRMIGAAGQVTERLAPAGWVRVAGELWRARTTGDALEAGAPVEVEAVEAMTLVVGRATSSRRPS